MNLSSTESVAIVRCRTQAVFALQTGQAGKAGKFHHGEGSQQSLHCKGSVGQAAWLQKEINEHSSQMQVEHRV